MNLGCILRMVKKDLYLGPRSPFFVLAIVMPFAVTALIQLVFGQLFEPRPRLGVVAEETGATLERVKALKGIEVTVLEDKELMWQEVKGNDLDAGLLIPKGFDAALKAGERPLFDLRLGGESLASNRIVLAVAMADLVRDVAVTERPMVVDVVTVGKGSHIPLIQRLLPMMLLYAVLFGGAFIPAFGLVDEKTKKTLSALLVSPASMADVMVAKGSLGVVIAMFSGAVMLLLNGGLSLDLGPLLVVVLVASIMMAELGLILGAVAKDPNVMMTIWKGSGIFLVLPVIPQLWEPFPQWAAMLSPTYYFLNPAWDIALEGRGLIDVAPDLAAALGICVLLLLPVTVAGRRASRLSGQT